MTDMIRITAPHFVAGLIPHNGRVVNAAPILRYMIHWSGKQVADYCAKKSWTWERVPEVVPAIWKARDSWLSDEYGSYFAEFEKWLLDTIATFKPDILAFESPILLSRREGRGTDEQQVRRLVGVVSIAEKVAYDLRLRCLEVHNQSSKSFVGVLNRKPPDMTIGQYKNQMIAAMTNRGFECADSHQADSCAIALVVFDMLDEPAP